MDVELAVYWTRSPQSTRRRAEVERLRRENPHRIGAALLRELAVANQPNQAGLSASTLYHFLRARGLTERQLLLDKANRAQKSMKRSSPTRSGSPTCSSAPGSSAPAEARC